jgi:putative nicotinate phosphoribosyltransferase
MDAGPRERRNGIMGVLTLTDRYEFTMANALIESGKAEDHAVFEVFARSLPEGRRYGVVAGIGRLHELLLDAPLLSEEDVRLMHEDGILGDKAVDYFTDWTPAVVIRSYAEGDVYFPNSPIVQVEGALVDAMIMETLLLSVLNYDSAVAAAASRMVQAAGGHTGTGRPIIEMGSRRTNEQAAVSAARAAYIAGFASTSNVAAGHKWGVPTVGTAAHAFTLAHESEEEAFAAQVKALGVGTTLLVDTYDIEQGIRTAVAVAGPDLGGIRIDSGHLYTEAKKARALLDELGAVNTRVIVTSDMDEYSILDLEDAPVDGFGAGTRVVTGSGHPAAGFVYKLVAIERDGVLVPVEKRSSGKVSMGGCKIPFRTWTWDPVITGEFFVTEGHRVPDGAQLLYDPDFTFEWEGDAKRLTYAARLHHHHVMASLPSEARSIYPGKPTFTVTEWKER